MKKLLMSTMAAALVMSFAVSAEAAGNKQKVAEVQASCKAQAAKKYSAIHFLKRRNFVNNCIAQHANAKAKPTTASTPAKPTTTGQAPKPAQ